MAAQNPGGGTGMAGLGRCALAVGDRSGGADQLRQAEQIPRRIGAPEAAVVAAEQGAIPA
jgi:hypothetical protein